MTHHRNQRIYLGPKTNEVILSLGRSYGLEAVGDVNTEIRFSRRCITNPVISTWTEYAIIDGNIHFEPPVDFLTNIIDFPKGFYDGQVFINDCYVADVELVKAPGHYVSNVDTVNDSCKPTDWVEPDCVIVDADLTSCSCSCNGDPETYCNCIYQVKDNCPTCYNETYIQSVNIKDGYVDWDDDVVDDCTIDDVTPISEPIP